MTTTFNATLIVSNGGAQKIVHFFAQ